MSYDMTGQWAVNILRLHGGFIVKGQDVHMNYFIF